MGVRYLPGWLAASACHCGQARSTNPNRKEASPRILIESKMEKFEEKEPLYSWKGWYI
jgi:hypothetical protein